MSELSRIIWDHRVFSKISPLKYSLQMYVVYTHVHMCIQVYYKKNME